MANILTSTEGANVLRCLTTDALMVDLLPAVDVYIKNATGRDWTLDTTIYPEAKAAARILLALWHENPAMVGDGGALPAGLSACLSQLEARALELGTVGVPDEALALEASMPAEGDDDVAVAANLILVFNHQMSAGSTSSVVLKNSAGSTVASTNALDATGKIMTVNPNSNLTASAVYTIDIDHAADIYGQTLDEEITFTTAP